MNKLKDGARHPEPPLEQIASAGNETYKHNKSDGIGTDRIILLRTAQTAAGGKTAEMT